MNSSFDPSVAATVHQDSLPPVDRDQLRRQMRRRRAALTLADRNAAATGIARVMSRAGLLRSGQRVGVYLAYRGEADLSQVIALARRRGCDLFLPAIAHAERGLMEFAQYYPSQALRHNRFGILEPDLRHNAKIAIRTLDTVLVPLVAVDPRGNRLGSGAGFYDRRFRHLHVGRQWRRPRLIGVAYEFQRVTTIECRPWDVPLDAVVTERAFYPTHRLPNEPND